MTPGYANVEFVQPSAVENTMGARQHTVLAVRALRNIGVGEGLFTGCDSKYDFAQ